MDWQAALRARLITDTGVAALVAQRVYWLERPQSSGLPAITLQTISEPRRQHLKGFEGLQEARVQVDAWAPSYAAARALAEAVIGAAVPAAEAGGVRFSRAMVDNMRDLSERLETQTIFRVSVDLIVNYRAATA